MKKLTPVKKFHLIFRAKMPDGTYFNQNNQYLTSFLRRVLVFLGASHPSQLKFNLEDVLEIKINNKWVSCHFN